MSTELWSNLLKESSKRSKYEDSLVVFLGDSESGKTKLVEKICNNQDNKELNSGSDYVSKEILSYNFFDVDEVYSSSDLPSKIGIWSIGDKCFDNALETVIAPSKSEKLVFLIGIDVSRPETECIQSLERWLRKLIQFSSEYYNTLTKSSTATFNLLQYLQTVKNNNNTTTSNNNISASHVTNNLGFPVVVVGCKSDVLTSGDDIATTNSGKLLQGKLRSICLQFGAALIYTSASKKTNATTLRNYITHRLYPESVHLDLVLTDSLETTFVPSGFDRPELISISTGLKDIPNIDWTKPPITFLIPDSKSVNTTTAPVDASTTSLAPMEIESEDDWLLGLQNYIKQAADLTGGAETATTKSRTNSGGLDISGAEVGVGTTTNPSSTPGTAALGSTTMPAPTTKPKRSIPPTGSSSTSGQDVSSFFQNLLASNPKK